jgi:hypothetical protein
MEPMRALALGLAILAASATLSLQAASAHRLRVAADAWAAGPPLRSGWGWGGATIGIGLGPAAPYDGNFGYGPVHYIYGYPYFGYASPCYLDQHWGPHGFRQKRYCP